MLQRFISVDREGTFSIEGDLRVLYSTMMIVRTNIISGASLVFMPLFLISLRYSLVRRQFKNTKGSREETQLLNYQTQQMKLFPIMAKFYGMLFASQYYFEIFKQLMVDIKKEDFKNMDLVHHFSSGMKSIYSQTAMDNIYTIRQSLGGAGYSGWSGIPRILSDYTPQVTFEGDNTVMVQQSCNYLLKVVKQIRENKGGNFDPVFSYIKDSQTVIHKRCKASKPEDFLDLDLIEEALKVNISVKLNTVERERKVSKLSKKQFIQEYALDTVALGTEHIKFITFLLFKQRVNSQEIKCNNLRLHMSNMCMLYGLDMLNNDSRGCFESGYFGSKPYSAFILDAMKTLNSRIRPQALNLAESCGVSDQYLSSAIGNYYGDIYETHLEWAKNSRLNKTKQGDGIPDGFKEYMTPIFKAKL